MLHLLPAASVEMTVLGVQDRETFRQIQVDPLLHLSGELVIGIVVIPLSAVRYIGMVFTSILILVARLTCTMKIIQVHLNLPL